MTRQPTCPLSPCPDSSSLRIPIQFSRLRQTVGLAAVWLFVAALASTHAQTPLCSNLPPGLVSWWRAEGNAQDAAGTNHGLSLNGVTFAPGKVGQAFNFSYPTNRIPVPTNGMNVRTNDFTLEGWIKTTSVRDFNAIFDYDSYNPAIYLRSDGRLQFYPHFGAAVGGLNDGRFHHFAVARQSGQVTYYKDGYPAGTSPGQTSMNAQSIYIGSDLIPGEQFDGLIDELTFYNRALSSNEVRNIFTRGSGGKCGPTTTAPTNAVADYQFNNTLASSVGNPPTLQNISSNAFVSAVVDGSTRTVLAFPSGSGLSLAPTTNLVASNNFSVVILMRFDAISAYRRILDTYGGITEEGLYSQDGYLRYYPASYSGFIPTVATGRWVQVTFTRSSDNYVAGYVDGAPQFSGPVAPGSAVIGANNSLRFFKDDGFDIPSGQVSRIRVFNSALAPEEVAVLDRLASVPPPDIALGATNLNFGNVTISNSSDLTLTVSNVGGSTLTITSLATNHSAFRVLSPATPLNVLAGTHAVVTLRFTPTNSATSAGMLSILSNDPDEANVTVFLSGTGVTNPPSPAAPPEIISITPLNAAPGSLVTIKGTNFGVNASDALVRFGNHVVAIQSISSTQIVVRLPLVIGGGVSVSVTVNGRTSAEFAYQVQAPVSSLRIAEVSLTATNSVRLLTQPVWQNPNDLLLESADSPSGPWWKEPDFQRSNAPGGQEFYTARKPYFAQRFFRIGSSPGASLPFIRYIAPNQNVRPGLSVTLLGANFSAVPGENTVRFELPIQSWTATVTAAATNYLVVTVPAGLIASSTGVLYRVTVTTTQGTGNGVGCSVSSTIGNAFSIRPDQVFILQPPGTGMDTLAVGGGVPPYQIVTLSSNDSNVASVTLSGPILTVVAKTNVSFGYISLRVQDSSSPVPQQAAADIYVRQPVFAPPFNASFHTLLAGTAPGLTMTARFDSMQPEQMELRFQNVQVELGQLSPGAVLGLVRLYYSSSAYGFQHLIVNEVMAGRATFDVISLDGGTITSTARGELIQNPPTIVINALGRQAATVMPTTVDQEILFTDGVLRLPGAGQSFSLTANFTSVSTRDDQYVPVRSTVTTNFTTITVAPGAPSIERLLPVHGEVRRHVELRGTGFDPNLASNVVTFAGVDGTRVPAKILFPTNGGIFVSVPKGAISGPVRVTASGQTGNDFSFSVRFHPDAALILSGLTNNTPTALRFVHQQPRDENETLGEVPLQSVTTTLDRGRLALTGVTSNQQVGTVYLLNFYTGRWSTNLLIYKGQEQTAPPRHRFEVLDSPGSTYVLARIYAADDTDGDGVVFAIEAGGGIFGFNAGVMWDYRFTTPIYRPPAAGTDVNVRIEVTSQQWMSIPNNEMRLIFNSRESVQ